MALFTTRDRIAFACIAVLILAGWTARIALHLTQKPDELRVIKNAVKVPEALESEESFPVVRIDINSAEKEELEILPMVGPVKAAAIVAYRLKNGPFKRTSDIMNVSGLGPATYEKIKDYISVGPEETSGEHEQQYDK